MTNIYLLLWLSGIEVNPRIPVAPLVVAVQLKTATKISRKEIKNIRIEQPGLPGNPAMSIEKQLRIAMPQSAGLRVQPHFASYHQHRTVQLCVCSYYGPTLNVTLMFCGRTKVKDI